MNNTIKLCAAAILSSVVFTSAAAYGASPAADGLKGANNQILLDITTAAGNGTLGSQNGAALSTTFRSPSGVAVAPDGSVLIADTRNQMIRKLAGGQVSTYAGVLFKKDVKGFPVGAMLDGEASLSMFQEPMGMAFDSKGNLYIADSANHAIRKVDASTQQVSTLAGSGLLGSKDGTGKSASFQQPSDVAVAADGTVYVADTLNHLIRSISPAGVVTTLNAASNRVVEVSPGQVSTAGDFADGSLAAAKFNEPSGLVLDAKGNLYVSDSGNQRIRYIDLQQGQVTTVAGGGTANAKKELYVPGDYADGNAAEARFNFPMGLELTAEGGLVIADSQNHSIRYLLNGKVTTLAGAANQTPGKQDGTESGAEFQRPTDVAVLQDGSIMVADAFNNQLRQLSLYQLPADLPKDDHVKVVLGPKPIAFDAQPEIVGGRTMVPVRAITEALGYKVTYDDANRAVQLSKDGVTVELYIDRTGVKRIEQGKVAEIKETDAEPYIKEDRTYVPVRFFAEEIGLDVQWNDSARTAILRPKTTETK
ncbi:stalk domain-containing protein [Paenibacillus cremeus]|uniref:Copper amine oxidase n=1 Tax=Paenibacillus cremeus TaxID=2163881 RepID=A0A559K814_9BACL|nr:stalk domain-containing protein [Paenibacillus cremeus]TVY08269.1 copper amine oxidase [Paenibacillus cremeus]